MFLSITAVVVGGTAPWGGIGGVWNTLVGVLLVFVPQGAWMYRLE